MKSRDQARKLAKTIVQVARKMGISCRAMLTNMDQPLGYAVGNALEVAECVSVLRGKDRSSELSSTDLKELTIQLCAQMLVLGKVSRTLAEGRKLAQAKLADGSAWEVFEQLVRAQGGNVGQIQNTALLPQAPIQVPWAAKKRGYIAKMDTESIGRCLIDLGGGRKKASDPVNPAVGLVFHRKLGSQVRSGDTIATIHAASREHLPEIEARFHNAIEITSTRKPVPKLILETL